MNQHAFEIRTPAGTIRGMAYRARASGRGPTAMMCHGFTGQRIEHGFLFVRLGRALAQSGIHAVAFDFLHSGESDGRFEQMRVSQEIRDALAVAHWLESQPWVDRTRLGGLGFSLGGLVLSGAHRRRGGFAALALIAPTTAENLRRLASETPDRAHTPVGPHRLPPAFFEDLMRCDVTADAARPPVPTLLAQGSADDAVPPPVSRAYADAIEAAGGAVERLDVDRANHVFGEPDHRDTLIDAVVDFFARALGADAPRGRPG